MNLKTTNLKQLKQSFQTLKIGWSILKNRLSGAKEAVGVTISIL
jgi:hypothetical protein